MIHHVSVGANDRPRSMAFHAAALAASGSDAGPSGPRPEYDANCCSAFVRDPDGHRIEAVTYSSK